MTDMVPLILTALDDFDPNLGRFEALRRHTRHYTNYTPDATDLHRTLDQALSLHIEAAIRTITNRNNLTDNEASHIIANTINHEESRTTIRRATELDNTTLILELAGYAMYLAVHTSYGLAPWRRFTNTINTSYDTAHNQFPATDQLTQERFPIPA